MEYPCICPDCRIAHDEPSDARLGHLVQCLDCAILGAERLPAPMNESIETTLAA